MISCEARSAHYPSARLGPILSLACLKPLVPLARKARSFAAGQIEQGVSALLLEALRPLSSEPACWKLVREREPGRQHCCCSQARCACNTPQHLQPRPPPTQQTTQLPCSSCAPAARSP